VKRWIWLWCSVGMIGLVGCGGPAKINDPIAELQTKPNSLSRQLAAMDAQDAIDPTREEYLAVLHRMIWAPGYTVDARDAALQRLAVRDEEALKRTIRNHFPNMNALEGRRYLANEIARRGWADLTPALVSGWARNIVGYEDDMDRPEAIALQQLHGDEQLADVVFDLFVESNSVAQQGLRTRCWMLLHRLGARERLVALLKEREPPADDAMLIDLHRGATELGIVPHNREEILWLRTLCTAAYADFWAEAQAASAQLDTARQAELELRDLPIVVSAARHAPELLSMRKSELMRLLDTELYGAQHYDRGSRYGDVTSSRGDRLRDWTDELRWGDCVAILIATRALKVPQVVDHLFDYAERDRNDKSTEYGGVIQLDAQGRFEVLEFPPRIRQHDRKFIASQAMLDSAYTALFHFHYHVQEFRNGENAGPGYGDLNFATNVRANCLVFTYVSQGRLNVDYYRHGRVVVDLGIIEQGS
jgi:hypothetical protein